MTTYHFPPECLEDLSDDDRARFVHWIFKGDWVEVNFTDDGNGVERDLVATRRKWDETGRPSPSDDPLPIEEVRVKYKVTYNPPT